MLAVLFQLKSSIKVLCTSDMFNRFKSQNSFGYLAWYASWEFMISIGSVVHHLHFLKITDGNYGNNGNVMDTYVFILLLLNWTLTLNKIPTWSLIDRGIRSLRATRSSSPSSTPGFSCPASVLINIRLTEPRAVEFSLDVGDNSLFDIRNINRRVEMHIPFSCTPRQSPLTCPPRTMSTTQGFSAF